jgi:hypothetical protein
MMMLTGRVDMKNKEGTVNDFVDYSLPNVLTLTGGNRWGEPGIKPRETLLYMFNRLLELGYAADEVIMGEAAYRIFEADPDIYKLLDNRRMELGIIQPSRVQGVTTEQYKATLRDPMIDIYTYNAIFRDPATGLTRKYIPDNMIFMHTPESRNNKMFFGAVTIIDENEDVITAEGRYVPEVFVTRRPPTILVQVTSRPIPAPRQIDSWFNAYVL